MRLDDNTQDRFTPDAGSVDEPVQCGVCGEAMLVVRNSRGPRGFVEAMGRRNKKNQGSPHDIYSCPSRHESWHRQVRALRLKAAQTVSGREEQLLLAEAEEVLKSRVPTKEISPLA